MLPELQQLEEVSYRYMCSGYRPNTKQNKRTHGKVYTEFCNKYKLEQFSASEWQMIRFACHLV